MRLPKIVMNVRLGLTVGLTLAAAGLVVFTAGPPAWQAYRAFQANRLMTQGEAAWRRGEVRAAVLAMTSAQKLAPADLRPLIRHGQMLLQSGAGPEARALFRAALAPDAPWPRDLVAITYHDALLGVGWWSELAVFAMESMPRRDALYLQWIQSAMEGVRLAAWSEAEWHATLAQVAGLAPAEQALLRASWAAGRGDTVAMESALADISEPLNLAGGWLIAQLWYRSGRPDLARMAWSRSGSILSTGDAWLDAVLGGDGSSALAHAGIRELVDDTTTAQGLDNLILSLGRMFMRPDVPLAQTLDQAARPKVTELPLDVKTAIWIYCGLAQASEAERFWREAIIAATRRPLLSFPPQAYDRKLFLFLVNALELRRDIVMGLAAALPVPAAPESSALQAAPSVGP